MNLKRRFLAIAVVLIVFALVLLAGILNIKVPTKEDPASGLIGIKKDTIYIWYTENNIGVDIMFYPLQQ